MAQHPRSPKDTSKKRKKTPSTPADTQSDPGLMEAFWRGLLTEDPSQFTEDPRQSSLISSATTCDFEFPTLSGSDQGSLAISRQVPGDDYPAVSFFPRVLRNEGGQLLNHSIQISDSKKILHSVLAKDWLKVTEIITSSSFLPDPDFLNTQVETGPHGGKTLFELLVHNEQRELLLILIRRAGIVLDFTKPIKLIEKDAEDPGKNFLWLLGFYGWWEVIAQLRFNRKLPTSAFVSQAQHAPGQGSNLLWLLAYWQRWGEINHLFSEHNINADAFATHPHTGPLRGINVIWLFARYRQWDLISVEKLTAEHLKSYGYYKTKKVTPLILIIINKKWELFEKLLDSDLISPDQLDPKEPYGEANLNLLTELCKAKKWELIEEFLARKLIRPEHLSTNLLVSNLLCELRENGQWYILNTLIDDNLITPGHVWNELYDYGKQLDSPEHWEILQKFIDRNLISSSTVYFYSLIIRLIEKEKWESLAKLINQNCFSEKILESSDNVKKTGNILWILAQKEKWDLILVLLNKNLVTTKALKSQPTDGKYAGKNIWTFLMNRDNHHQAAQLEVIELLIRQKLVTSEILQMKPSSDLQRNLLTSFILESTEDEVQWSWDVTRLVLNEVTPLLLLESSDKFEDLMREDELQGASGFLVFLLSHENLDRVQDFITVLLLSPLHPLSAVPWDSFQKYTVRLVLHCWQQKTLIPEGHTRSLFHQLLELGIAIPSTNQIAAYLPAAARRTWIEQGGPPLCLEKIRASGEEAGQYFRLADAPDSISSWLLTATCESNRYLEALTEELHPGFTQSKNLADHLCVFMLRYGGCTAFSFLQRYNLLPKSFAQVTPFMSAACVEDWLLNSYIDVFERYYFSADLSHKPSLPTLASLKSPLKNNFIKMVQLEEFYHKHSLQTMAPRLGLVITDFDSENQQQYWSYAITKKAQDSYRIFYYLAAEMTAFAVSRKQNWGEVISIIFAYLEEADIVQALLKEKSEAQDFTPFVIVKKELSQLIDLCKIRAEFNYRYDPPQHPVTDIIRSSKFISPKENWIPTVTDNDSIFHALFGEKIDGVYFCSQAFEKRLELKNSKHYLQFFEVIFPMLLEKGYTFKDADFVSYYEKYQKYKQQKLRHYNDLATLIIKNSAALAFLEDYGHLPKAHPGVELCSQIASIMENLLEKGSLRAKQSFLACVRDDPPLYRLAIIQLPFLSEIYSLNESANEYMNILISTHYKFELKDLLLFAHEFQLLITCHIAGEQTRIFGANGKPIEIYYEDGYFYREPKPASKPRYLKYSKAMPSEKDEISSYIRSKIIIKESDRLLHLVLGKWDGEKYFCPAVADKRARLAKLIADSWNAPAQERTSSSSSSSSLADSKNRLYQEVIKEIQALILDKSRSVGGKLLALRMSFFQQQEIPSLLPSIFKWEDAIQVSHVHEYADYLKQGQYSFRTSELAIIAYAFDRRIVFYPSRATSPQLYNKEAGVEVSIQHGAEGWGRLKVKKTKREKSEVVQSGRAKLHKTMSGDAAIPVSAAERESSTGLESYLYELIIGGKKHVASKLIQDYSTIDYAELIKRAEQEFAAGGDKISWSNVLFFIIDYVPGSIFTGLNLDVSLLFDVFQSLAKNADWDIFDALISKLNVASEDVANMFFAHPSLKDFLCRARLSPAVINIWNKLLFPLREGYEQWLKDMPSAVVLDFIRQTGLTHLKNLISYGVSLPAAQEINALLFETSEVVESGFYIDLPRLYIKQEISSLSISPVSFKPGLFGDLSASRFRSSGEVMLGAGTEEADGTFASFSLREF